jgi:hypothetical protein
MMKHLRYLAVAALATVGVACSEAPTDVNEEFDGELVITEGVAAPEYVARERPVFSEISNASASLGASSTTPLTLKPTTCESPQSVVLTFSVTGNQLGTATFKVNSSWTYNGTSWLGSVPVSVTVPPRAGGTPATIRMVTISVANGSGTTSGTTILTVPAFDVTNSNTTGAKLDNPAAGAGAQVHVAFAACPVLNTPPTLVLPDDMNVEATSSSGAAVTYVVTATDAQDGDLTAQVLCTPASGSIFALGTTTVNCSVTDAGGLEAIGSFDIKVEDTTPAYFTAFPSGTINLIAADIDGAVLDVDGLDITVADVGNVSEPSTFSCDYVAGTKLAIGSTTPVYCTATDAIGNESDASSFDVFVGLNVNGTGFLPPLRMVAPFSAHKKGSTIPHKFLPPTYADGTPAIDLAGGLKLAIRHLDWQPEEESIQVNDYSAGSTEWRYDPESGHYIFNLKTQTNWAIGSWNTTVSYADIPLATTQFELRK